MMPAQMPIRNRNDARPDAHRAIRALIASTPCRYFAGVKTVANGFKELGMASQSFEISDDTIRQDFLGSTGFIGRNIYAVILPSGQ
eukprot:5372-Alexandrium_andersonii.AAC.1